MIPSSFDQSIEAKIPKLNAAETSSIRMMLTGFMAVFLLHDNAVIFFTEIDE
jgi:hypothetical protein